MKKAIAAISLVVYFAATSGIVINSHYCMHRLVSVTFFEGQSKVCAKCGMGLHKGLGCCRDEIKVVKGIQDQNKIPQTIFSLSSLAPATAIISDYFVVSLFNIDRHKNYHNHSPPLLSMQDSYLQYKVFRI